MLKSLSDNPKNSDGTPRSPGKVSSLILAVGSNLELTKSTKNHSATIECANMKGTALLKSLSVIRKILMTQRKDGFGVLSALRSREEFHPLYWLAAATLS